MSSRNLNLDYLRGVSIVMVMLLHALVLTDMHYDKEMVLFIERLSLGVPFFFILSGYVIALNYRKRLDHKSSLFIYFVNRGAKILPLYWLFLFLWYVFFYFVSEFDGIKIMPQNTESLSQGSAPNYIFHLFFLQGFEPSRLNTLLDGDWSIINEVYFYILFPLIARVVKDNTVRCIYLLCASYALAICYSFYWARLDTLDGVIYYTFIPHLPEFLLGFLAFRITQHQSVARNISKYGNALFFTSSILMLGFVDAKSTLLGSHHIFTIGFVAILVILVLRSDYFLPWLGFISKLGRQSYALYFTHLLLLKIAFVISENFYEFSNVVTLGLNLFIVIPLSLLLSNFVFHNIDNFFVNKVKSIYHAKVTR